MPINYVLRFYERKGASRKKTTLLDPNTKAFNNAIDLVGGQPKG